MRGLIKKQEDDFINYSPSYDQYLCPMNVQDSNNFFILIDSPLQQIMTYLENQVDICNTPLAEIIKIVDEKFSTKEIDYHLLKKKILKQKYLMKRNRAKNRRKMPFNKRHYHEIAVSEIEQREEEEKKQKNRISAQTSRDRKKLRVQELEEMNKKLQEECKLRKTENEKLLSTIQSDKIKRERPNLHNEKSSSRINKMLILLGIICLLGLIKDVFSSNGSFTKIKSPITNSLTHEKGFLFDDSIQNERKMIQTIESPLEQFLQDENLSAKFKNQLRVKVQTSSQGVSFLPNELKCLLQEIKTVTFK